MQTRVSPIRPDLNGVTVYGQWLFSKLVGTVLQQLQAMRAALFARIVHTQKPPQRNRILAIFRVIG